MTTIPNRSVFFDKARVDPFGGSLEQSQIDGMNALLDCWDGKPELQEKKWLAYMLATQFWETKKTMQPQAEESKGYGFAYGEPHENGQRYYGRGYVPVRWIWNYSMWDKNLNRNGELLKNPDMMLEPRWAAIVLIEGTKHGLFTGIPLGERHGGELDDPLCARQAVDGLISHAKEVAAIYRGFLKAI